MDCNKVDVLGRCVKWWWLIRRGEEETTKKRIVWFLLLVSSLTSWLMWEWISTSRLQLSNIMFHILQTDTEEESSHSSHGKLGIGRLLAGEESQGMILGRWCSINRLIAAWRHIFLQVNDWWLFTTSSILGLNWWWLLVPLDWRLGKLLINFLVPRDCKGN